MALNRTGLNQNEHDPLREGEGALLQCDVDAKPASDVRLLWYRDGVPIAHANTRMLAITVLDRSFNNSRFTCEATNSIGKNRGSIALNVHCTSSITISTLVCTT